jgi:hypothetical protein
MCVILLCRAAADAANDDGGRMIDRRANPAHKV